MSRRFQFSLGALLAVVTIVALWLPWRKNPWISMLMLYSLFLIHLVRSAKLLPDRVASHFNSRLEPDAWMSRRTYLLLMAALGLYVPVALFGLLTKTPELATGWFSWFGCLYLGLMFGVHLLIVHANRRQPARLSRMFWALLAVFLAGMVFMSLRP